jgi:uncharacterized protein (DUF2345 family)
VEEAVDTGEAGVAVAAAAVVAVAAGEEQDAARRAWSVSAGHNLILSST